MLKRLCKHKRDLYEMMHFISNDKVLCHKVEHDSEAEVGKEGGNGNGEKQKLRRVKEQ